MDTIDLIIVFFYLLAIVMVGMVAQKKASKGIDSYFLGNRKLPICRNNTMTNYLCAAMGFSR